MKKLAVLIITLNEEFHIANCINSVRDLADEIIVLDSFSEDNTAVIAEDLGAIVIQRKFDGFGNTWNYLANLDTIQSKWSLKLDPDERLTSKLKKSIKDIINSPSKYDGYTFNLHLFWLGKEINAKMKLLRLWKTGKCHFSSVIVNEHPIVRGEIGHLKGKALHLDSQNFTRWLKKQINYSIKESIIISDNLEYAEISKLFGSSTQRRMFYKKLFWKLPFKHIIFFINNYFVKGTFLNGKEGFYWAVSRSIVMMQIEILHFERMKFHK